MITPAAEVEAIVAAFAADAARGSPLLPLANLIARLRDPLREAPFWARTGEALLRAGFAEPAAALLAAGLQHHRDTVELRYLRGNALRVAQQFDEAERELRAVLAAQPAHRNAALSLAFMLREQARIEAAAAVVAASWRADAGDAAQTLTLLDFLRECGAHRQARAIADAARGRWPGHGRTAAVAGELALALGDFPAARAALQDAIRLDPAQSAAWLRLSYCQRYATADDPDIARFETAWRDAKLPLQSRICAGFALAKARDELDDCAAAAPLLREANALAGAEAKWDAARWQALIERQAAQPALPALAADPAFVPVFIVGLPRTGTTLVATRLGRHPLVRDRGELNWIGAMHDHLAGQNALGNAGALEQVAALIGRQMRRDDAPARCYVDKNPLNFRYLNLIAALFPNARVIHCRRDAGDTALSIWSQHFAHPDLGFSYAFATIARVADDERRLMAHWRATTALPVLEVDYEMLVADAEGQFARMARFLELDEQAFADDARGADGVITTASVWQARQPIHAGAIGRWRRYAPLLPELRAMEHVAAQTTDDPANAH